MARPDATDHRRELLEMLDPRTCAAMLTEALSTGVLDPLLVVIVEGDVAAEGLAHLVPSRPAIGPCGAILFTASAAAVNVAIGDLLHESVSAGLAAIAHGRAGILVLGWQGATLRTLTVTRPAHAAEGRA